MSTLAYESHGAGTPVVLLHGLTFDRTSWHPIIDRLGDVHTIAVDLPAHGESAGPPAYVDVVAGLVHELVEELGAEPPVVVGHSVGGAIAMIYAATYPTRGVVLVDSPLDVRAFLRVIQPLAPALRGPHFDEAFAPIQQSMRVPAGVSQQFRQDVVLGYWDELLAADPEKFQQRVATVASRITVPALALFGDAATPAPPNIAVETWPGAGHMLHLVEPDRFADRLRAFVASATPVGAL